MTIDDPFEAAMTEYALNCGDESVAEQVFKALQARRDYLRAEGRVVEAEQRLAEVEKERERHEAELERLEERRGALALEARMMDALSRAAFEVRLNPMFVWGAVLVCDQDEPLPGWVRSYLCDAAAALFELADGHAVDPRTAARNVARALGLSRPGFNGFEDLRTFENIASARETARNEPGMRDSDIAQIMADHRISRSTAFRWLRDSKLLQEHMLRYCPISGRSK